MAEQLKIDTRYPGPQRPKQIWIFYKKKIGLQTLDKKGHAIVQVVNC
jgi:hypothetical protein